MSSKVSDDHIAGNSCGPNEIGKIKKQKKTHDKNGVLLNKCQYINPKRNRQCGLQCRKDQKYCFAHIQVLEQVSQELGSKKKAKDQKEILKINDKVDIDSLQISKTNKRGEIVHRVRCTIDPSHTVWEDKLVSHVKKCNVLKKQQEKEDMEANVNWYSCNYNVMDCEIISDNKDKIDNEEWIKLMNTLLTKYESMFPHNLKLDEIEYREGLEDRFAEVSNQKHIRQQSSLIGQLVKHELIGKDKPRGIVVEFGCGRAEFSRYLNKAVDEMTKEQRIGGSYLFIDRDNPRLKFDNKIVSDSKDSFDLATTAIKRLKVDIKDLKLFEALKELKSQPNLNYIGISKHLCGVATDLTLRCLKNAVEDDSNNEFRFDGFLVAMCCRHCCQYDWLLPKSKQYLNENFGVDADNFKYFRKMFSWATNGMKQEFTLEDTAEHFTELTFGEREQIGLKMRRILDESRVYAMAFEGYDTQLIRYCKREWSLENNCMLIKKRVPGEADL